MVEFFYYEICGQKLFYNQEKITSMYDCYEVETIETFISPNMVLPIKKCVVRVYEMVESVEQVSNAALITKLKDQAYKAAQNKMPNGAIEERVAYDVFNDNEYYRVVCNIQTTTNIGERK